MEVSSGRRLGHYDDGFGQGVVVAVSNTSDRHVDSGLDQPLGVSDGQVLHSAVQVMGQTVQRRDDGGRVQDWESLADQYA